MGIPTNDVNHFIGVQTVLSVPLVKQFGKSLGAEYNGHEVYETINGGNQVGINTTLQNGLYDDPVGVFAFSPAVPLGNPNNVAYPQLPATVPASTQNIPVIVAGSALNPSVANRTVSYGNGTLTITWP